MPKQFYANEYQPHPPPPPPPLNDAFTAFPNLTFGPQGAALGTRLIDKDDAYVFDSGKDTEMVDTTNSVIENKEVVTIREGETVLVRVEGQTGWIIATVVRFLTAYRVLVRLESNGRQAELPLTTDCVCQWNPMQMQTMARNFNGDA